MAKIINKLSPLEAASAASVVYAIEESYDVATAFKASKIYNHFQFSNKETNRITAKSGVFEFKTKTGFGVIAKGIGDFENDAIIVCRGTASGYDALTDLNTGIQQSLTGYSVHAGFNRTFNDFSKDIIRFINTHQPRTVHCVGHSLGGALATLSADLVTRKGKQAALYTFGCPRVGFTDLATNLSQSPLIGKENIHRVFHSGDPVAMVPLWPFVHAPQPNGECYIGKVLDFNPWQHKMSNYIESISNHKDWKTLTKPQPSWDAHIEKWMTSDEKWTFGGLNLFNITMVMHSIKFIIKDIIRELLTPIGIMAIGSATILDQLSFLLDKASKLSDQSGSLVLSLMKRILSMLGISIKQGQNLTHPFIKFVLNMFITAITRSVSLALQVGRVAV